MGQTLTHGIYLPDEGERNCYNGLAANWQILDNSVGTIAANTAALAGKAPLVHTHVKADITDFPAYGNSAGTICEGNDSRLSDARTPVAHTHTKSDVTDLLNSDFIPSANNSYDLGSSSYQWNNAYIKSLTINGVACGDILTHNASEFVDVSSNQTIGGRKNFNIVSASDTVISKKYLNFNDNTFIYISGGNGWNSGGQISLVRKGDITIDDSGNIVTDGGDVTLRCANNLCGIFDVVLNVNNSIREPQFSPTHNKINLGTSTNKWKTLNGVNPGALSLPDKSKAMSIDTTNFAYNSNFTFTPTVSGWLFVSVSNCTVASLKTGVGEYYFNQSSAIFRDTIPVIAGEQVTILLVSTATSKPTITLFHCLGNVS